MSELSTMNELSTTSESSKRRKIDNGINIFESYDENIYFHILKHLDLVTLWKLRRVSRIFLDIFKSYSNYNEKILLIGLVNNTLTNDVKVMNNSFETNTFNCLDIQGKKDNICLHFLSKFNSFNKNSIFFIPNYSTKIETISYDHKCEITNFPDKVDMNINNNATWFNITKNNNIFLIKNQLGILLKSDNIFKFNKYVEIRELYKCGLFKVLNLPYIIVFGGFHRYYSRNYYPFLNSLSNKIEVYYIERNVYKKFKSKLSFATGGFGFINIFNKEIFKHYSNILHVCLIFGGWIQNNNYIEPTTRCYLLFFLTNGDIKYRYLPNLPINIVYPNITMDKNGNIYVMGGKNPSKIMSNYTHCINENRILYFRINYKDLDKSKWYILPKKIDYNIEEFLVCNIQTDSYFYLLEKKNMLKNINSKICKLKKYLDISILPYCSHMLENYCLRFPDNIQNTDYQYKYSCNLFKFISFLKSNNMKLELKFEGLTDVRKYVKFFLSPNPYIFNKKKYIPLTLDEYNNTCLFYFSEYDTSFEYKSDFNSSFKKSLISECDCFKYKIKLNEMQKKGYECKAEISGQGKNTLLIIHKTNELYLKTLDIRKQIQFDLKRIENTCCLLKKEIEQIESKIL